MTPPAGPPLAEAVWLPGFDPAALADGRPSTLDEPSPLAVRDFGPEGFADGHRIRVRFDQAVVDLRDPATHPRVALTVTAQGAPGQEPHEVAGRSEWTSPDALEWLPGEALPRATEYEVVMPAGLRGRDGTALPRLSWRFETPRPQPSIDEVYEPLGPREGIRVELDQPVDPEVLARFVEVRLPATPGAEPRPVPVRVRAIEDEPEVFAIEPERRWPRGVTGTLVVAAGLTARAGPLPLLEPVTAEIATRDRLRVLAVACEDEQDGWCREGPIRLRLSTEVEREALAGVTVTPAPAGLLIYESWDDEDDRPTIEIDGELETDRRYRISLPASLTDVHGQRLGRRFQVEVGIDDRPPRPEEPGPASLWLSSYGGIFPRASEARVGVLAEHLQSLRVRTLVLSDEARLAWLEPEEPEAGPRPWPEGPTTTEEHELRPLGVHGRAELVLDLSRFAGPGDAVLVEVEPLARTALGLDDPEAPLRASRSLFQISGLGVEATVGPARGVVRITGLDDGRPRAGVSTRLEGAAGRLARGRSDAHGLLRIPGAEAQGEHPRLWIEDPEHDDRLAVALREYSWPSTRGELLRRTRMSRNGIPSWVVGSLGEHEAPPAGLRRGERALVAVEAGRGIVLPSDTLHLVGWGAVSTPYGELSTRRAAAGTPVSIELVDRAEVLALREVELDEHGRFALSLPVPEGASLGPLMVKASMLESSSSTSVMVADARIPTFELEATMAHAERIRGQSELLQVRASYLSGEPASLESLHWVLTCHDGWFHPEGEDGWWTFGARGGSAWHYREGDVLPEEPRPTVDVVLTTDALDPLMAHACSVAVAGQEASLQQVGADASFFVHPASVYLGVRPPMDADVGERLRVQLEAVDTAGRRVAQPRVELRVWPEPEDDEAAAEPEAVARCVLDLHEEGEPAECRLGTLPAGAYAVVATASVGGIPIRTDARFHVSPPPPPPIQRTPPSNPVAVAPAATEDERRFEILAPEEAPVDRPLSVSIEAPWAEADGMLTVSQTGLREAMPFTLHDGEATVSVTPRSGRGRRLELRASVARPPVDGGLAEVHEAAGAVWLRHDRELRVEVVAPREGEPGASVPLRVVVRDARGQPVDARLAVWVVDDGLHQLRPPHRAWLETLFDPDRPGLDRRSRSHDELRRAFHAGGLWGRGKRVPRVRAAKAQVKGALDLELRSRFEAVPLFEGNAGTGPDGELELRLPLPDDLTRFRVSAVASAELPGARGEGSGPARFGRGDATISVSAPLMVRAVLPRVLRPGDRAELAALVTLPEREGTLEVELAIEDEPGVLAIHGPSRVRRAVDGEGSVRVPFVVEALGVGTPAVRLLARFEPREGEPLRDGVRRPLRVEVERTQVEHAAIHGRLDRDEPVAIPVRVPDGARADLGGLELSVRSTMLGDLDEAAAYLLEYPYGCLEQTASRLVPLLALAQLRDRLPPESGDPDAMIAEGLARLRSMQLRDGRFGYWPGATTPAVHGGAYATWVMSLAARAGHPVSERTLERALDALGAELEAPLPSAEWGRREAWVARAVGVHVLVDAGRGELPMVVAAIDDLVAHRSELPLFARAMLLMAAHGVDPRHERVALLRRGILSTLERAPGVAQPVEPTQARWQEAFDSSVRSHALVLMAMMRTDPDDPVVDELARGLQRRQEGGRWGNTQENAYGLLALAGHAARHEVDPPDLELRAWMGQGRAQRAEQRGRDAAPVDLRVSMAELLGPLGSDRTATVVLDREGQGTAYYRLGMEWAVDDGDEPPARSQGLSLERILRGRAGPVAGALHAGARYEIELTIETDLSQHYLAIEVPLPAGLEAIDPSLGAGQQARVLPGPTPAWWVSHQELHGDRVLIFADELPPGRHVHRVPVLATTPGRYRLPPATAEAMYAPELRARTTGGHVRVTASER
ncbi:MAG: hypothetical protein H6712_21390 [Myxococcales bacterium]|nr:hypothetical protein [Myxococcales bacterium]